MIEGEQHEGEHRGEVTLEYISVTYIASEEGELLAQSWRQCCRKLSCKFLQILLIYHPRSGVIQHNIIRWCVDGSYAVPVVDGVRAMEKIFNAETSVPLTDCVL